MRDAVLEALHDCQIGFIVFVVHIRPQPSNIHTRRSFCLLDYLFFECSALYNCQHTNTSSTNITHVCTATLTNALLQTGRVSPRTSTRGGDAGSKASQHSNSPIHSSPLANEVQLKQQSLSNTPNLNPAPKTNDGKGTEVVGTGTAVPGSLGGRSTAESMPVHKPSQGFRDGGDRGITKIDEEGGGAAGGTS